MLPEFGGWLFLKISVFQSWSGHWHSGVVPAHSCPSINEGIWVGGKDENVDKIHVICCLADLLIRFQIIKFT